ncbi:hypothetical protein MNEG_0003 [Monoraphidium neglectum]|uniref:Uncharacterized protein n=1 Tax=Monoraphidium neglectum TaxID=145388 RepID=A0A0D2MZR7_9CHLO|nr:hypothetical protein MNEG_0003 [Monoraphidium neglectum]KIZ07930.1 hypothetical protein MNEG_0003 [Monoraphidium neglectum]|eukprot:XP_013906949.1 hypothetical protein MNEG_0003 [Monoraphidium neglectum]
MTRSSPSHTPDPKPSLAYGGQKQLAAMDASTDGSGGNRDFQELAAIIKKRRAEAAAAAEQAAAAAAAAQAEPEAPAVESAAADAPQAGAPSAE